MDEIRCAVEWTECRERRGPGRLRGTLLTYGERAHDRPETFAPGALTWPQGGVPLRRMHRREAPIMLVEPRVDGDRLVIDQELPDTQAGRDAATEVRSGLLPALSVEFRASRETRAAGLRRILAATLKGAGLVDSGAYAGSRVEVRGRRRRLWL